MIWPSFFMVYASCLILAESNSTITIPADEPNQQAIAAAYRIQNRAEVQFTVTKKFTLTHSQVDLFEVRFPSAVTSRHTENNVAVAEYFCPRGVKAQPGVIVLDILDGAGVVSRGEAVWLASRGIPALCLTMPYYGPRRPPEATAGKQRFLSPDIEQSKANIRQGILDARRALCWLAAQPEVDEQQLGVVGTSLGSFLGAILAGNEPRIRHAALLLGGGDLVASFSDHPQANLVKEALKAAGITPTQLNDLLADVDPITYASELRNKRLLLIGANRDDVVPPIAMKRLWEATARPRILWVPANHVGAALYLIPMLKAVREHILAEK